MVQEAANSNPFYLLSRFLKQSDSYHLNWGNAHFKVAIVGHSDSVQSCSAEQGCSDVSAHVLQFKGLA